ncbi:glycosyl hydrolases family 18-domain-containing protein [Hypoxylon crocopeplum]|nr:glycosyl hydrolases family 18-domain-containing protein [Hypoxylon crocopeplum]
MPPQPVIIPNNMVVLEYNCHFMPAICQNADNWLNGNRGANRDIMTNLGHRAPVGTELFSYDMGGSSISKSRGDAMCPSTWRNNHQCPEQNQPSIMPGPWFSNALETIAPLKSNEIEADRSIPNQLKRSGRYYTCDEFPPRSFVEGGAGTQRQNIVPEGDGGRGETYCAPSRLVCSGQVRQDVQRSEQDWQASAHVGLRSQLRTQAGVITRAKLDNRAVLFALSLNTTANANAPFARILWGPNQGNTKDITYRRRYLAGKRLWGIDGNGPSVDFDDGSWSSMELHANGSESVTHARRKRLNSSPQTPSCQGDSAARRRLAYYQAHNVRDRHCNTVDPNAINTTGLTHLVFSHIDFDNATLQISPGSDTQLLQNFTSLARNNLQTWVAVGGQDLAWSNMTSAQDNRTKFIRSLGDFLDKYGFQGVDLNWDNPGGNPEDTGNLVSLVHEMNGTFKGRYGVSIALPPDSKPLGKFDLKKIEPYVDFFGFKAFDLHGPWECSSKGAGIRPHTDVTDIDNDLQPLWVAGVDPSKVNLGIASYGRSYKLRNDSCTHPDCGCIGPGDEGRCTASKGVLSSWEIQAMISSERYKPQLNETAMVKYLTYGNSSWVSYDDKQTIDMKEKFASSRCLGGLIDSSIDLQPQDGTGGFGGSNNTGTNTTDSIWVSPEIWNNTHPEIVCSYPCTLVLPPWTKTTTTVSYPTVTYTSGELTTTVAPPPLTISVWWVSTIVIGEDVTTPPSSGVSMTANVTMFNTTAWPPVTFTDSQGKPHTTRAHGAPPIIPPAAVHIPPITVPFGLPPRPTALPFSTPCVAGPGLCLPGDDGDGGDGGEGDCPDLQCDPTSGGDDDGGGDGDDGDGGDDDGDDGEDDGDSCSVLPPTITTSSTISSTSSTTSSTTTSTTSTSHSHTTSSTTSRTTSSHTTSSRTTSSRTTSSHTTSSHTTSSSSAASTPTSCSGSKIPSALIYAWSDYNANKFSFRGLDYCATSRSQTHPESACSADWAWTQSLANADAQSQIASDLQGISVFGSTCSFRKDDGSPSSGHYTGKLTCERWRTARCTSGDVDNHEEQACDSAQKVWWNYEWSCVWG